jgi:uncharacterized membrane protein YfhO
MKHKQQLIRVGLSWGLLLAFMVFTKPTTLPVVVLIVPFILLFIALLTLWRLLQALGAHYLGGRSPKSERLGFISCICIVLLVILQSLGQLTLRDSLTVVALATIGYLYILRARPERRP